MRRLPSVGVFAVILLASGCSGDRPKLRGAGCSLNSECEAPLVCRISRCRTECAEDRDCARGLACLLDADRLGGCQLEEELECVLDSDCTAPLVCRGGECGNECTVDRDCPLHSVCAEKEGGLACEGQMDEPCVYHSDCAAPLICDDDQICRLECTEDRDCIEPRVCSANRCTLPDGGGP